ncbi:unnamed protein product [Linum trigynum]|uniref:F-box/LRR-repeat protein 15/At3g58940/PEG3-like LRR domain-containing protein n=1 Tax=Linum trigynum TaxID=586398 RepID=A0AAV2G923_9ROSI
MNQTTLSIGGGGSDRISALPDEIIHQILRLLPSLKEAAKAAVLSKRWGLLWRSYPVLQFDNRTASDSSKSLLDEFAAAASTKFNSQPDLKVEAVRIHMVWKMAEDASIYRFVVAMLKLVANREPEEVDIQSVGYPPIPARLINHRRLKILNLRCFQLFWQPADTTTMINLRVLCLADFSFYDDGRLLNAVIASAPLLETLTLSGPWIGGDEKIRVLQICNHPNLKTLKLSGVPVKDSIQISGAPSLQTLTLKNSVSGALDISLPLPNLESLEIEAGLDASGLTEDVLNDLIAGSPSLQSLKLDFFGNAGGNLLNVVNPNLQWLWLRDRAKGLDAPGRVIRFDAPKLVDFDYGGSMDSLPAISYAQSPVAAQLCEVLLAMGSKVSITIEKFRDLNFFFAKLIPHFPCIRLWFFLIYSTEGSFDWDQVEDDLPAVPIYDIAFRRGFSNYDEVDAALMEGLLWSCHPKYLCIDEDPNNKSMHCPSLEYLCKFFTEITFDRCRQTACKCWRHELKDVKIVSKKDDDGGDDDELADISIDSPSSLGNQKRVTFRLNWC